MSPFGKRSHDQPPPPKRLVSAATLVRQETLRSVAKSQDWQAAAWEMYDEIGELHSGAGWLSHSLSRAKLYVGELPDDRTEGEPTPTSDARAKQPLNELFGGPSGHPGMLGRLGLHLTVPGVSYVIGLDMNAPAADEQGGTVQPSPLGPDGTPVPDSPNVERRWMVASNEEFDVKDNKTIVRLPDSDAQVEVDVENSTVIRLWNPHARRAWDADSPVRACLPVLRELINANARITADLESRLAGAGILILPASASVARANPDDSPDGTEQLVDDADYATLIEAMVTPIGDRESASAVVPILIRVDDQAVDKVKHISFSTNLDAKVLELRDSAIRRLALGLDVPPEVLLGMTDANHWTGWQIEESAVKLSVEPLLTLIVNALTVHYLRPALTALGVANPERFVIWYDLSDLILRPNRFEQAYKLWQDGMLGAAAVVAEAGFSEDDMPDSAERAEHLLVRLLMANVAPETARPYLMALGLKAPDATTSSPAPATPATPPAIDAPPPDERALPDTTGNPDSGQPGPAGDTAAALVASAGAVRAAGLELAVLRALEIAGKRLLSQRGRSYRGQVSGPAWLIHTHRDLRPVETELDRLLTGAYDALLATPLGRAPGAVELVDGYVRGLLLSGVPHSSTYLAAAISQYARRQERADAGVA